MQKCQQQKVRGGRVNRIESEMLLKQDTDHVNDPVQYMSKLHVGAVKEEPEEENKFGLYKIKMNNPEASIMVPMTVNGTNMSFELDTGASKTVISEQTWHKQLKACDLQKSSLILKTYAGERLEVLEKAIVDVVYEKKQLSMPVHVTKGSGPSLFGRDWQAKVNLNWGSIKKFL